MSRAQLISPALRAARRRAFTIVELLVAVTVLTFIIVGLYAMFNQTQRAWRASVTQVDVLEGARSAMEMMARELAGTAPSRRAGYANFYLDFCQATGSRANMSNAADSADTFLPALRDFWFLSRAPGGTWNSTAYFVDLIAPNSPADAMLLQCGVGTLYRHHTNVSSLPSSSPVNTFLSTGNTNQRFQRVLDGVVYLQLVAYDHHGDNLTNYFGSPLGSLPYSTSGDKVPGAYELELAMLEPRVLDGARALPSVAAMRNYLSNQLGKVHIFRQRITVPSAER